jgi:hypothetical protein
MTGGDQPKRSVTPSTPEGPIAPPVELPDKNAPEPSGDDEKKPSRGPISPSSPEGPIAPPVDER